MNGRREFLKRLGIISAGSLLANKIIANPYNPVRIFPNHYNSVKIKGAVKSGGKSLKGVPVTDGQVVVQTSGDGTFEIISGNQQRFVYISIPSGYLINQNETGTALFYKRIKPNQKNEMFVEFDLTKNPNEDNEHSFLLLADPQTRTTDDIKFYFDSLVPDIKKTASQFAKENLFGLACGDIMWDKLEFFPEYEKSVKEFGIPCFQVLGNHDCDVLAKTDEQSAVTFMDHFGPTYYSFNKGEIHYVVLDDIFYFGDYFGYFDQKQLDWLKQDLSFIEKGKTVVVFTHIPPYNKQHERQGFTEPNPGLVVVNRELLYKILEPYKSFIITGHMHESEYLTDGGSEIHVCGAVCGAWWTGPICNDGTPNGYLVYNTKGSELSWQYKSAGFDINHQMRVYKNVRELPDKILANVWTVDNNWEVNWYENGMKKGRMERILAQDPLAIELQFGKDLPKRIPAVEPAFTDHIFSAEVAGSGKEIIVEAIDRWGRIYTEKIII